MRIQNIKINHWRNFRDIEFSPQPDAPVVCIVGANGTGKSQILELIAACAHRLGLTPGYEHARGDPFAEQDASFEVTFKLNDSMFPNISKNSQSMIQFVEIFDDWDKTITIKKTPDSIYFDNQINQSFTNNGNIYTISGGIKIDMSEQFSFSIVMAIRNLMSIHYLSIGAERAYPQINVSQYLANELIEKDWKLENKLHSSMLAGNMYFEWIKYVIGIESQHSDNQMQILRDDSERNLHPRIVKDVFQDYAISLKKILNHLKFNGINMKTKQMKFKSGNSIIYFDQLSSGEKEIAFIVGQIDRFGLKKGILLIDEPELHLNSDMIRSWTRFLKESVEEGQIWMATHSLEVVESAGVDAAIIIERNDESRFVDRAIPLSESPVHTTLSRALGSAAFSISNLAFVIIESEEHIGERERFRSLCNAPSHVRFIESSSCKEVIQRIDGLKAIAKISGDLIRIGGVVDQDWRSKNSLDELRKNGIFVLDVHEIENFYLEPKTLEKLGQRLSLEKGKINQYFRESVLKRAGSWIYEYARADDFCSDFPKASSKIREKVHLIKWVDFQESEEIWSEIGALHGEISEQQTADFVLILREKHKLFKKLIDDNNIWTKCEGKEIWGDLCKKIQIKRSIAENMINHIWEVEPDLVPESLQKIRAFVSNI